MGTGTFGSHGYLRVIQQDTGTHVRAVHSGQPKGPPTELIEEWNLKEIFVLYKHYIAHVLLNQVLVAPCLPASNIPKIRQEKSEKYWKGWSRGFELIKFFVVTIIS